MICALVLLVTIGMMSCVLIFEYPNLFSRWTSPRLVPSSTTILLEKKTDAVRHPFGSEEPPHRSNNDDISHRNPKPAERRHEDDDGIGIVLDNNSTANNTTTAPTASNSSTTAPIAPPPSTSRAPASSASSSSSSSVLLARCATPCYTTTKNDDKVDVATHLMYQPFDPIQLETSRTRTLLVSSSQALREGRRIRKLAQQSSSFRSFVEFRVSNATDSCLPTTNQRHNNDFLGNGNAADPFTDDVRYALYHFENISSPDILAVWSTVATVYSLCRSFSFDVLSAAYDYNKLNTVAPAPSFAALFDKGMPWDNLTQVQLEVTVDPFSFALNQNQTSVSASWWSDNDGIAGNNTSRNRTSSSSSDKSTGRRSEIVFVTAVTASCTVPSLSLAGASTTRVPGQMIATTSFSVSSSMVRAPLLANLTNRSQVPTRDCNRNDQAGSTRSRSIVFGAVNASECALIQVGVTSTAAPVASVYGGTSLGPALLHRLSSSLAYVSTLIATPSPDDSLSSGVDELDDEYIAKVTPSPENIELLRTSALTTSDYAAKGLGFCALRFPTSPWAPTPSTLSQTGYVSYFTTKDSPLDNQAPGVAIWTFLVVLVFSMFLGIVLGVMVVRWCLKQEPLPSLKEYVERRVERPGAHE